MVEWVHDIIAFISDLEKHLDVIPISWIFIYLFSSFIIIGDWQIRGMAVNWPFGIFLFSFSTIFSFLFVLQNQFLPYLSHCCESLWTSNHYSRTQLRYPASGGLYQGDFRSISEWLLQWFMCLWEDMFLCWSGSDLKKVFLDCHFFQGWIKKMHRSLPLSWKIKFTGSAWIT